MRGVSSSRCCKRSTSSAPVPRRASQRTTGTAYRSECAAAACLRLPIGFAATKPLTYPPSSDTFASLPSDVHMQEVVIVVGSVLSRLALASSAARERSRSEQLLTLMRKVSVASTSMRLADVVDSVRERERERERRRRRREGGRRRRGLGREGTGEKGVSYLKSYRRKERRRSRQRVFSSTLPSTPVCLHGRLSRRRIGCWMQSESRCSSWIRRADTSWVVGGI
jgi:hypothetical protein